MAAAVVCGGGSGGGGGRDYSDPLTLARSHMSEGSASRQPQQQQQQQQQQQPPPPLPPSPGAAASSGRMSLSVSYDGLCTHGGESVDCGVEQTEGSVWTAEWSRLRGHAGTDQTLNEACRPNEARMTGSGAGAVRQWRTHMDRTGSRCGCFTTVIYI